MWHQAWPTLDIDNYGHCQNYFQNKMSFLPNSRTIQSEYNKSSLGYLSFSVQGHLGVLIQAWTSQLYEKSHKNPLFCIITVHAAYTLIIS